MNRPSQSDIAPEPAASASTREALLGEAARRLEDDGTEVARAFYQELARRHPHIARHFAATDLDVQAGRLAIMLRTIVAHAGNPQRLGVDAMHLGVRHAARGIDWSEYAQFNATLAGVLARRQTSMAVADAERLWVAELMGITEVMLLVAPS